jgi:hypothetical protein
VAEITVSEDEGEDQEGGAAHAAAVHEGAAQVHEEHAAESAESAAAAATIAAGAAEANAASIGEAEAFANEAAESAAMASAAALACQQAVEALTAALESNTEQMRLDREAQQVQQTPAEPAKKTTDKPPATRKKRLGERYYGG